LLGVKGGIGWKGLLYCVLGNELGGGKGLIPILGAVEKLGNVSLGMYLSRFQPLDCWAAIGAARFCVVLTGLNVKRRGWLLNAVRLCALPEDAKPIPMTSAAQIALRTRSPPLLETIGPDIPDFGKRARRIAS